MKMYCSEIISWIQRYYSDIPIMGNWLALRGLTKEDYLDHLSSGGPVDGLELWCALVATRTPLNVVIEDTVWSTVHDGVDLQYISVMLCSYTTGFICCSEEEGFAQGLVGMDDDLQLLQTPPTALKGGTSPCSYSRVPTSDGQ